jgi:hypothetical protein
METTTAFV